MNEHEQSGGPEAMEIPKDDYILHSETQANAAAEHEEASSEINSEAENENSEAVKKRKGLARKLDLKDAEIAREREEKAALLAELERLKAPNKPKEPAAQSAKTDGEPSEADYDNYADYIKAWTRWDNQQQTKAAISEYEKSSKTQAEQAKAAQEFQAKAESFDERISTHMEANPGYEEKVDALDKAGLITPGIVYHIVNSDIGVELSDYLVNNPQEVQSLARMQPQQLAVAFAKLEGRLEGRQVTVPAVRTTKSPPPIAPVKANSPGNTKNPGEMSYEEYDAWRRKSERR